MTWFHSQKKSLLYTFRLKAKKVLIRLGETKVKLEAEKIISSCVTAK